MLNTGDHDNGRLFTSWGTFGERRRELLKGSWASMFRAHILFELPIEGLRDAFHAGFGRPTKDIYIVVGALLLQQLHDTTDEEKMESLALNIGWHYALDITNEVDAYICEKTLRNYRRLLVESGLDSEIFRRVTDKLLKKFKVDSSRQRMDSTALRSAMRGLSRTETFARTIDKFLRELARKYDGLVKRYCGTRVSEIESFKLSRAFYRIFKKG